MGDKYIFMAYDSNGVPLNDELRNYAKDSLVFDMSRHSIYAQKKEFGYVGIKSEYQSSDSNLAYSYIVTYMYRDDNNNREIVFTYTDLTTTLSDYNGIGGEFNYATIEGPGNNIDNSGYVGVITNIHQDSLGKISYVYTYVDTTHYTDDGLYQDIEIERDSQNDSEPIPSGYYPIAGVKLSPNGHLSYTYIGLFHIC